MTSRELTAIDQTATEAKPVETHSSALGNAHVWFASTSSPKPQYYFAFFNPDDQPVTLHFKWNDLWLRFAGKHRATNLWEGTITGAAEEMEVALPAHGSAIYRVE
jgi:hypothetical protein